MLSLTTFQLIKPFIKVQLSKIIEVGVPWCFAKQICRSIDKSCCSYG